MDRSTKDSDWIFSHKTQSDQECILSVSSEVKEPFPSKDLTSRGLRWVDPLF
jgi:hypothetical protein